MGNIKSKTLPNYCLYKILEHLVNEKTSSFRWRLSLASISKDVMTLDHLSKLHLLQLHTVPGGSIASQEFVYAFKAYYCANRTITNLKLDFQFPSDCDETTSLYRVFRDKPELKRLSINLNTNHPETLDPLQLNANLYKLEIMDLHKDTNLSNTLDPLVNTLEHLSVPTSSHSVYRFITTSTVLYQLRIGRSTQVSDLIESLRLTKSPLTILTLDVLTYNAMGLSLKLLKTIKCIPTLQLYTTTPAIYHEHDKTYDMFKGIYHGKSKHDKDLDDILSRAWNVGMDRIMITSGRLSDVKEAIAIIDHYNSGVSGEQHKNRLFTTIGVHPTRCTEIETYPGGSEAYFKELIELANNNKDKIVAVGEFGLDYDRLEFCPKETQIKYFELQFQLAQATNLPLFLHLRNAFDDFINVIEKYRHTFKFGVVHSFDGNEEQVKKITEMGLHIGINGCSLKTEDNLNSMASIPSDRLLIETDAPWCDVRKTHAGHKYITTQFDTVKKEKWQPGKCVQARNEPCNIIFLMKE
ncbi:deoxyribonuclease [Cavenderia fasciculata]|uniref:Deoxyribonuclease n=1 Tax=Cavenderia fasciculata TaxID=261658 RepID=F4QA26_CACFS|nr:deoxyribonuclease [Cavenderia fasciculata]EGG15545.1 deoxyribonuclease [Cavenderia fasciculata]|eukprot:XP_004354287.1 deoxyribonuclease [Cavenderia fasciculata]